MVPTKTMSGEIRRLEAIRKKRNATIKKLEEEKVHDKASIKKKDKDLETLKKSEDRRLQELGQVRQELENAMRVSQKAQEENHDLKIKASVDVALISRLKCELAEADAMTGRMTRKLAQCATSVTLKTK